MPTEQDQYEVCIDLVTMAGTECTIQTNITHYEDMMQLEDDILCFPPTVSDIDVFGCEVELIDFATQLPLPAAVRVPINPRREIADRTFCAAPMLRHVEIAEGIQHVGFAAWQESQQLQIVKLPSSVLWSFSRLLCPGCVQFSRRVFACSLSGIGVSQG